MLATPLASACFVCRKCGESVPAGPLAIEAASRGSRLAIDRQCPSCMHRALYYPNEMVLLH